MNYLHGNGRASQAPRSEAEAGKGTEQRAKCIGRGNLLWAPLHDGGASGEASLESS